MTSLLLVEDVHRRYGEVEALKGVELELFGGEVLGLLGPNGAGKSTLISIMAGLDQPTSGSVRLGGGVRTGLMPQEHAIYPTLTARENLDFVARAIGLRRRDREPAVAEVLARVGLTDVTDKRTGGFSGGMKRRLGFATAVLGSPEVLLLDEPTVGVDPQSRLAMLELIQEQVDAGVGIIYSTHYMEELERLAQRVAILDEGSLLAYDPVDLLLAQHGDIFLEFEVLRPPGVDTLAIFEESAVLHTPQVVSSEATVDRLRAQVLDRTKALDDVLSISARSGLSLSDLRFREPTLEAVFISLTGKELHG